MTVQEGNFGFWIELLETRPGHLNSESFKITVNAVNFFMRSTCQQAFAVVVSMGVEWKYQLIFVVPIYEAR